MDIRVAQGRSFAGSHVVNAAYVGEDASCVTLDLASATKIDLFGLVAIGALAEAAISDGQKVTFVSPRDYSVAERLSRMHVGVALDRLRIDHALPEVEHSPAGDQVVELRRFHDHDEVEDFLSAVYFNLVAEDEEDARTLYYCVAEAIDNLIEHSGETGGWMALEQYVTPSNSRAVAFAVADTGIGLRTSLCRSASLTVASDREAMGLAIQRGVSRTDDPSRGRGLHGIIEKARERSGHVRLWSGGVHGISGTSEGSFVLRDHPSAYHGTIVYATLRYA